MKFSCGVKHSLSSSSLLSSVRRKPGRSARDGAGGGGPCLQVTSSKDRGEGGGNIINPNQPIRRRRGLAQLFDETRGFESSQRTKT